MTPRLIPSLARYIARFFGIPDSDPIPKWFPPVWFWALLTVLILIHAVLVLAAWVFNLHNQ